MGVSSSSWEQRLRLPPSRKRVWFQRDIEDVEVSIISNNFLESSLVRGCVLGMFLDTDETRVFPVLLSLSGEASTSNFGNVLDENEVVVHDETHVEEFTLRRSVVGLSSVPRICWNEDVHVIEGDSSRTRSIGIVDFSWRSEFFKKFESFILVISDNKIREIQIGPEPCDRFVYLPLIDSSRKPVADDAGTDSDEESVEGEIYEKKWAVVGILNNSKNVQVVFDTLLPVPVLIESSVVDSPIVSLRFVGTRSRYVEYTNLPAVYREGSSFIVYVNPSGLSNTRLHFENNRLGFYY